MTSRNEPFNCYNYSKSRFRALANLILSFPTQLKNTHYVRVPFNDTFVWSLVTLSIQGNVIEMFFHFFLH